ncbi:MAG: hypothetical protein K8963_09470, partial [Proteobacteria bacterium]|nr:hypothetical protein [Pseudomonadota bacterium]
LPQGLTLARTGDNSSCQITGTTEAVVVATTYTVMAVNNTGSSSSAISIAVVVVPLASPNLANAQALGTFIGMPISVTFTNTGGSALTGCMVDPTLPQGLTLSRNAGNQSCQITGMAEVVASTVNYTVTAENSAGSAEAFISITIDAVASPVLLDAPNQSVDVDTAVVISFINSGGGDLTSCISQPVLPGSLVISRTADNSTCQIIGVADTPSLLNLYTITATNVASATSATINFAVNGQNPPSPQLTNIAEVQSFAIGQAVNISFVNTGGGMLSSCRVQGGLPAGLLISRTPDIFSCQITGTAREAALLSSYTIAAVNAGGGRNAQVQLVIIAEPAATAANAFISTTGAAGPMPATGDVITFVFEFDRSLSIPPQALIGGQFATISAGGAQNQWQAVVTTLDEFASASAGFTVQVAVPNGGVDGVDLYLAATVSSVSNASTVVNLVAANKFTIAPILQYDTATLVLILQQQIRPIIFFNEGGSPTQCTAEPMLPDGLVVELTADRSTCQITGRPTTIATLAMHTISATNASSNSTLAIEIAVAQSVPVLRDLSTETVYTGQPFQITFPSQGGGNLNICTSDPILPPGLNVFVNAERSSCRISGTTQTQFDTAFEITGTNALGSDSAFVDLLSLPGPSDALDTPLTPVLSGDADWFPQSEVTFDGIDALQSGRIDDGQMSCFTLEASIDGMISFHWRASSSSFFGAFTPNGDPGVFRINGVFQNTVSGQSAWVRRVYDVTSEPGVPTLFSWCYLKRGTGSSFLDTIWVDQIVISGRPVGLNTSAVSVNSINLAWDAWPGATNYRVFRNATDNAETAVRIGESSRIKSNAYTDATVAAEQLYYYWVQGCDERSCSEMSAMAAASTKEIDANSDGLIEISSLGQLHNVRHNLAGSAYEDRAMNMTSTIGCPIGGCRGYQLTGNLDFDRESDGTWVAVNAGNYTLDSNDSDAVYFNTENGGWAPIGDIDNPFTGVFDGNGFTIANLAVAANLPDIGLFGVLGSGAWIRNLGLTNALLWQNATNEENSYIGAVAGRLNSNARLTASYASGVVVAADGGLDHVGGLVGQSAGTILASYATNEVFGGGGADNTGGLVGTVSAGDISASYATGNVYAGAGNDNVGGLVGSSLTNTDLRANYAGGTVDGGDGNSDMAGNLVGLRTGTVTASYGFGAVSNGEIVVNNAAPVGVSSAAQLTAANVDSLWNSATSNTQGAWDFGNDTQAPAIRYADYDGTAGMDYSCTQVPTGSCNSLLPGQRVAPAPLGIGLAQTGHNQTTLSWLANTHDVYYLIFRGTTDAFADATEITTGQSQTTASFVDSLTVANVYYYWVRACAAIGCSEPSQAVSLHVRDADADADGLIEIASVTDFNNVRHNLAGTSYMSSATATPLTIGCPGDVCRGYELVNNINFDTDNNGTWTANNDGTYTLDSNDNHDEYFNVTQGGWLPLGTAAAPFNAIFDGNGFVIANIAVVRAIVDLGVFGATGANAVIRNLGLT